MCILSLPLNILLSRNICRIGKKKKSVFLDHLVICTILRVRVGFQNRGVRRERFSKQRSRGKAYLYNYILEFRIESFRIIETLPREYTQTHYARDEEYETDCEIHLASIFQFFYCLMFFKSAK